MDRNLVAWAVACVCEFVALRKESVDRNADGVVSGSDDYVSLSARRAWIEMRMVLFPAPPTMCRSPQGERG